MFFVNFTKSKQIYNGTNNISSIYKDEQGCKQATFYPRWNE